MSLLPHHSTTWQAVPKSVFEHATRQHAYAAERGSTYALLEFERQTRFTPANCEDCLELPWFQPGKRRAVPLDIFAEIRFFKQSLLAWLCNVSGNIFVAFLREEEVGRAKERDLSVGVQTKSRSLARDANACCRACCTSHLRTKLVNCRWAGPRSFKCPVRNTSTTYKG